MLQKQPSELALLCEEFRKNNHIEPAQFEQYQVKRGLRNPDGTGVMAGLTHICNVHGYLIADGEKVPDEGRLTYRGINVKDIVDGCTRETVLATRRWPGCCCSALSLPGSSWKV